MARAAAAPAPPKSLKSTALSTTSIKLSWHKVSKVKQYTLYQQSGSKYVKVASTKKTAYSVKKLKAGKKYYFKVNVKTSKGTSKKSKAVAGYTKCIAPAGITATTLSKTSVKVTWKAVSGAQKYKVYASKAGSGSYWLAGQTAGTSFTVAAKLSADTPYYFKIAAVNGTAVSSYSAVAQARTTDGSPIGVTLSLQSGSTYMPVSGGTCTLIATVAPANADRNTAISWSSSDSGVAAVDQTGKVTAAGAGDAVITAATANGKTAAFSVKVAPNVTGMNFYTVKQPSGTVTYDMQVGATIPMYMPTLTPANAYGVLLFRSNSSAVSVVPGPNGTFSLKANGAGSATITATSHNGLTSSFVINVKTALTNVQLPASYTMAVNTDWTVPVTLTPASGAYGDYVLTSSDPTVLRIEQNKTAHSIKPGTAKIQASINGAVKSTCTVTVSSPAASTTPGMKYYNVTYESSGKATVSLGIVPVTGAQSYLITEHVAYNSSMTPQQLFDTSNIVSRPGDLKIGSTVIPRYLGYREWIVSAQQAVTPLTFNGVDTGLRFFSVAAYSGANCSGSSLGTTFVLRAPVLYYPRNVGGANQSSADGYVMAYSYPMTLYIYPVGLWTYFIPSAPIDINLTFDKVPGAAGYEIAATLDGTPYGGGDAAISSGNRIQENTGFTFQSGDAVFNIKPYVLDNITGARLYGEMRTVTLRMKVGNFGTVSAIKFWETSGTFGSPTVTWNFGV